MMKLMASAKRKENFMEWKIYLEFYRCTACFRWSKMYDVEIRMVCFKDSWLFNVIEMNYIWD